MNSDLYDGTIKKEVQEMIHKIAQEQYKNIEMMIFDIKSKQEVLKMNVKVQDAFDQIMEPIPDLINQLDK